jgi:prepilin-type N-terminal cleavage/methylation domain-containing protein
MEPTMTSATSVTLSLSRRRAFTLIELLVVIGIIVIIAGLAIPMSIKAYRAGDRARTAADLQSISVGLEAFKTDWGDYPRPDTSGSNTGFAALGRYLIGPYGNGLDDSKSTPSSPVLDPQDPPAYNSTTTYHPGDCVRETAALNALTWVALQTTSSSPSAGANPPVWATIGANDGYDGAGMKRPIGGRVLGPYLQADKIKTRGLALLDRQGNPILYFPASPGKPNIHAANGYAGTDSHAMYNVTDNEVFFRAATTTGLEATNTNSVRELQMLLGDYGDSTGTGIHNGQIDPGETEASTAAYILWSAGPDGIYGPARIAGTDLTKPQATSNYDDVTNFR